MEKQFKGKIRFVFMHQPLPFHQFAQLAAEASEEANRQGKFWQYHDLLFANQQQLDRPNLERFAQQAGLDMNRFRAALDGNTHRATTQADSQIGTRFGARGTPSFFINGRPLRGAVPKEQFVAIITEELARAKRLLDAGISRPRLYAELIKGGQAEWSQAAQQAQKAPGDAANRPPPRMPDPNAVYKVPVGSSPAKGPATAAGTIIEFTDFQ